MKRRSVLGWSAAWLATGVAGARAAAAGTTHELPLSAALDAELAAALAARRPLVVLVSLEGCAWCQLVRQSYLLPMSRGGESLRVVQLDMRSDRPLRDFAGAPSTHDRTVRGWGVKSAPTVLFFGPRGREVAPRLVGASPDFYGAYLEQRLRQAQQAVTAGT